MAYGDGSRQQEELVAYAATENVGWFRCPADSWGNVLYIVRDPKGRNVASTYDVRTAKMAASGVWLRNDLAVLAARLPHLSVIPRPEPRETER